MRQHRRQLTKQRGVALITAIVLVALATILAVQIGFKGYLGQRRATTMFAIDKAYQVALGAEALAADTLMDGDQKRTDFSQKWAVPIQNLPIEGGGEVGEITGGLEDVTGRFNLNQLAEPANQNDPALKQRQQQYIEQFKRILAAVQLEAEWADKIVDWIDSDSNPSGFAGGEDEFYSNLSPPYRTANRRITRVSELLALPDFGIERYSKLEPLVTALPLDAPINICTAPGIVLDSFSATQQQYGRDEAWLLKQRANGCFPELNVLATGLSADEQNRVKDPSIANETSHYFRATIVVTIGTNRFTLYSLLKRDTSGVRAITRSFGTT